MLVNSGLSCQANMEITEGETSTSNVGLVRLSLLTCSALESDQLWLWFDETAGFLFMLDFSSNSADQ